MRADRRPRRGHEGTRRFRAGAGGVEHVAVVAAFDEADVLRFGLGLDRQAEPRRLGARLRLGQVAER